MQLGQVYRVDVRGDDRAAVCGQQLGQPAPGFTNPLDGDP